MLTPPHVPICRQCWRSCRWLQAIGIYHDSAKYQDCSALASGTISKPTLPVYKDLPPVTKTYRQILDVNLRKKEVDDDEA